MLAENFSIVEQNFGDLMSNVLDRVVSDAFQIYNQDPYFLEKISYNSYIFTLINKNHKFIARLIENIVNYINLRKHFSATQNIYFLLRVGLAEHTNNEDIKRTFNKAQVSLFELRLCAAPRRLSKRSLGKVRVASRFATEQEPQKPLQVQTSLLSSH